MVSVKRLDDCGSFPVRSESNCGVESAMWNTAQNIWDFFNGTIYLVALIVPTAIFCGLITNMQLPRTPLDLAAKRRDYGEMNITQAREQLEIVRLSGDEQNRKLKVRIQGKIALPFVCVVFGLLCSFGNETTAHGRATGFGSVVVIFSYYLLNFISDALGVAGVLSFDVGLVAECLGAGGLLL